MKSRHNAFLFFKTSEDATEKFNILEKSFPDTFSQRGKIISAKDMDNNDFIPEIKKAGKDTESKYFLSEWFSDSISEIGLEFFDYENNVATALSQSFGAKNIVSKLTFMISCGMSDYIEELVFNE